MNSQPIILSIIIISHNQRSELKRCVESVLAQRIPFEYEIIISDDRSTDGTWELAQEYEHNYPDIVRATQCNSDDCNPANNSQRSGWNRCNGYKLASGKYIAHVDADDYFRAGSRVYQHQVELLEQHPECSLCMQNVWVLTEGEPIEKGKPWFSKDKITEEKILTPKEFIEGDYFILNQAFVQRRNPIIDPTLLYGKRYVDSVITYHHLQFGSVICVDSCDYVYLKHPGAVTTTLGETDRVVLWCLGIFIPALIPVFRNLFYQTYLTHILRVVNLALNKVSLNSSSHKSINDMGIYIYSAFNRTLKYKDYFRLNVLRLYIILMIKLSLHSSLSYSVLHFLLTKKNICPRIPLQ